MPRQKEGTYECGGHGAVRYTWPGDDERVACIECATKVQSLAQAMGFQLQVIPLGVGVDDPIPDVWPTCQQLKKKT